ncbi:hypothetical protein [Bacillus spizizenii]|uniref:hypothetical protein n=1 Tax=Bacillus spizizenii TaxID=96241 RepID=UPI002FC7C02E
MKVSCDDCLKEFEMQPKEHPLNNAGIEETYFKCPHCSKHYTVIVTDYETRKMIRKHKKLRKTPDGTEEADEVQRQIMTKVDALKKTYGLA